MFSADRHGHFYYCSGFFFHGDFCHKAVWVYVTVPKCCVSPVIGWFVFLYAQSSSAGARAEAVGPAK